MEEVEEGSSRDSMVCREKTLDLSGKEEKRVETRAHHLEDRVRTRTSLVEVGGSDVTIVGSSTE
jgi:hypothetical protein